MAASVTFIGKGLVMAVQVALLQNLAVLLSDAELMSGSMSFLCLLDCSQSCEHSVYE